MKSLEKSRIFKFDIRGAEQNRSFCIFIFNFSIFRKLPPQALVIDLKPDEKDNLCRFCCSL